MSVIIYLLDYYMALLLNNYLKFIHFIHIIFYSYYFLYSDTSIHISIVNFFGMDYALLYLSIFFILLQVSHDDKSHKCIIFIYL